MIKKKLLTKTGLVSALGLSLLTAVPSVALADFFSSDNPIYVGVGFGKTTVDTDAKFIDEKDTGKMVFIGKQFNKNIFIEAYYADLGKYSGSENVRDLVEGQDGNRYLITKQEATIKLKSFGIKANYMFDLDGDFKPYATLGFNKLKNNQSGKLTYTTDGEDQGEYVESHDEDGTGIILGAGIQKKFDGILVRGEYTRYKGKDGDVDLMWLGASKQF